MEVVISFKIHLGITEVSLDSQTVGRPKKIKRDDALDPRTVAMRTSGEYAAWVDRLAEKNRTTVAGLLDQALAAFAKQIGFDEEPPRR